MARYTFVNGLIERMELKETEASSGAARLQILPNIERGSQSFPSLSKRVREDVPASTAAVLGEVMDAGNDLPHIPNRPGQRKRLAGTWNTLAAARSRLESAHERDETQMSNSLVKGRSGIGTIVVGALAVGTVAFGAMAIGALAVGALTVRRLRVLEARIEKLSIGTLTVDHLDVRSR